MKQIYRYLPLSDEVRARNLYVIAGGSAFLPPGTPYPPATHPRHHGFHWHQGRVLQEYQMIYTRTLSVGDLFVLFPNEWHRYSPDPATGWDEHWAAFQGRRAAEMIAGHSASTAEPLFHTDIHDLLQREFVRIEEEVAEEAIGYQNVAAACIQLIFALALASHQRKNFPATDVVAVINLAAELHVGYSWLRRMFRQYTGLPLAQYQMQLRLNHACELLRSTPLSISSVGCRSGFESAYYFARVFRNKMGYTPSECRSQLRDLLLSTAIQSEEV